MLPSSHPTPTGSPSSSDVADPGVCDSGLQTCDTYGIVHTLFTLNALKIRHFHSAIILIDGKHRKRCDG
jgi:hypothetical protein